MRKKKNLLTSLLAVLMLTGISLSQTTHDVTVSNFSFSPAELIITVGDAVRWTNVSGTHNVLADDNSFTSGPPAPAPWEYTHTFTTAGNNPYYCEPHGGPGGSGMSGVITVMDPVSVPEDDLIADCTCFSFVMCSSFTDHPLSYRTIFGALKWIRTNNRPIMSGALYH